MTQYFRGASLFTVFSDNSLDWHTPQHKLYLSRELCLYDLMGISANQPVLNRLGLPGNHRYFECEITE